MKSLLIVDIDENIEETKHLISKNNKDLFILYLNDNIINKSFKHNLPDHILEKKINLNVYNEVRKFTKNWYKPIENELKYFNISLGALIEMSLLHLWPTFFKIDVLFEFINKNAPLEVNVITEYEEDIKIVKEIIKNKKIKFKYYFLKKHYKRHLKNKLKEVLYKCAAKLQNSLFKAYLTRKKKKNNILFLGNLRQTMPLLKKLKENKNNIIIRAGENLGRGFFSKYCDYYITFKEYSKFGNKIKLIKQDLNEKFNKLKLNKTLLKNLHYRIPLYEILKDKISNIFINDFTHLIKYIDIMREIGRDIDLVVAHNDILPFEKSLILTANKIKVPTLTMIEGFLPIKQIKKENLFVPFNAQKMALYSKSQKQIINKRYKIPEDRLVVTGYPLFDQYYSKNNILKEEIFKSYDLPEDKKIILYSAERYNKNKVKGGIFGAYTQNQIEKIYFELFDAIKNTPNTFVIIKQHPSGSPNEEIIEKIAKEMNFKDFLIIKDVINIKDLLTISDCLITRLSTMGFESMLIKKPVIIFDTYFNTNDTFDYTHFNAALHAKRPGELKILLKNLLENKNLQEKLIKNMERFVKYNYINDGNSSDRMANLINTIIEDKRLN